jgi:integrase
MPRRSRGPRLWLRPERRDTGGRVTHAATWLILDGSRQLGTGCHADDRRAAEQALGTYLNSRHLAAATTGPRDPSEIPIADVLTLYLRDVAPRHSRPGEAVKRLRRLGTFFAGHTLADINGPLCREYAEAQNTDTMARRDLEELRAAINHHRREGLHDRLISVVAPPRRPSRERWLTRSEAARLIWAAWRFREVKDGRPTSKRPRRHIAHFILVALYTGSRASVVSQAALQPEPGRPYVDLDHGMLYRRPAGAKESNKRRPTIPLPEALIAHLRRWKRAGHRYVVEWDGHPVRRIGTTFRHIVKAAKLGPDVTPHTLRHTAATWMMQAGTDLWEAGGYLGMTASTLERVYGHHHPAHLENARSAFQRHRTANISPSEPVHRE